MLPPIWACRSMDRTSGYEPDDEGSTPSGPTSTHPEQARAAPPFSVACAVTPDPKLIGVLAERTATQAVWQSDWALNSILLLYALHSIQEIRRTTLNRVLLIVGLAAFLTACGSPPKYAYVKDGASGEMTQSALSKCEYQIKLEKTPSALQNELRHLCMEGEGYRLKRVR